MSILQNIFGSSFGQVITGIDKVIGRFKESPDEKNQAMLEIESLLQKRDSELEQTIRAELAAKERVLVAELSQGDAFTKRARPSVVYFGLLATFINYILIPSIERLGIVFGQLPLEKIQVLSQPMDLPTEFWVAWGGIVGTWVIGRSAEKRGSREKWVGWIAGNKKRPSSLLLEK